MRLSRSVVGWGLLVALAGCAQPKTVAPPPSPPPPAPPRAAPPPPPRPAVISPQTSPDEQRRLAQLTSANLESAEQRLKQLGDRRLSAEQQDTAQTIRGFIVKAREALGANDMTRASTLSDKARILADELARNVR